MRMLLAALVAAFFIAPAQAHHIGKAAYAHTTTECIIEHELAHAGGWPAYHPGAIFIRRCGGLIMPPHKYPLRGVRVRFHYVPASEIGSYCGFNAIACTYMSNPADIWLPLEARG